MSAAFPGRSRARSGVVTTMAQPPSLSWQQSKRRSGSAIMREPWCSSCVSSLPWKKASGLFTACLRVEIDTWARSLLLQPVSCM